LRSITNKVKEVRRRKRTRKSKRGGIKKVISKDVKKKIENINPKKASPAIDMKSVTMAYIQAHLSLFRRKKPGRERNKGIRREGKIEILKIVSSGPKNTISPIKLIPPTKINNQAAIFVFIGRGF